MIQKENIKLKTHKSGTLIKYFTTYSGQTSDTGTVTYLLTNSIGQFKIVESLLDTVYVRNQDNNFELIGNFVVHTGTTLYQKTESLSTTTKNKITNKYTDDILNQFNRNSNNNNNQLTPPITYVEFEDIELDDLNIDINLNRTIDVLDTLSIDNIAINEQPSLESTTGVLFGKLEARQNILDSDGKQIKIPLKNTVVCIFTRTESFPDITSTDDNGNRIALNLKENVNTKAYFNKQALNSDLRFLTDTSQLKNIPPYYKYTCTTNDQGEFILHDVPVGEQTFMFEVNMLRQGLTPDEVALNFFSYPLEENALIDRVPHYFFRQFPINVVPSWGYLQSGYTELNITVDLDLRKWITYYVPPIAFKSNSIEDMRAQGIFNKVSVGIRDMTKPIKQDTTSVEIVEVQDIDERDTEQILQWTGEFKQRKKKAEFDVGRFNVFKLPANLYDPYGFNSNGQKGVWLGAYQFKLYYSNKDEIYRATGFQRNFIPNARPVGANHYDLNTNADLQIVAVTPVGQLGQWPYEKPWSLTYPEPYKIPKPPVLPNPNKQYDTNGEPVSVTEPKWLDGDMVGDFLPWAAEAAGYGLQSIGGALVPNEFAREVTKLGVYKYEDVTRWDVQYSNGYLPVLPNGSSSFGTISNVLNGEKWQRLEAGFAYWLKPEGWPRIKNHQWGDELLQSDYINNLQPPPNLGPSSYRDGIYKLRENILLRLDSQTGYYRQGALDIYKVLNPEQISPPLPPPVDKFIKVNLQDLIVEGRRSSQFYTWLSVGSNNERQFNRVHNAAILIQNIGTNKVEININGEIAIIQPGDSHNFDSGRVSAYENFILPANNGYDTATNSYTKANYKLTLWSILSDVDFGGPYSTGTGDVCYGGEVTINHDTGEEGEIPEYYLVSVIPAVVSMNTQTQPGGGFFNWIVNNLNPLNLITLIANFGASLGIPGLRQISELSQQITQFEKDAVNTLFGSADVVTNGDIYQSTNRLVAINGFAYCTWRGDFPLATNDWVATYYDTAPRYTKNPYMWLLPQPLNTPFVTPNGGNYPFGLI